MNDVIAEVQERLRRDFAARIERSEIALGTGFYRSRGVEIPLVVSPGPAASLVRLSEAGETWGGLVSDGYTDGRPTVSDLKKIEELCRLFGVQWDASSWELYDTASIADVALAARRIIAAALALDGWRAWYPPVAPRALAETTLSKAVTATALRRGWRPQPREKVQGTRSGVERATSLTLHDGRPNSNRRAAVEFTTDPPKHVIDHVAGWVADTDVPLVVVAPPKAVDEIVRISQWSKRVRAVPRKAGLDVSGLVIDAAENIAA